MLEVLDFEHFQKVKQFAEQSGLSEQFQKKIDYLKEYGDGNNICKLGKDFAPYSFSFTMYRPDGKFYFNGGLIYQGPDNPADGSFPSLTVSLAKGTDWFIHT